LSIAGEGDTASFQALFLNPPPAARSMTRWWWFGGAMTPEEITRELAFMRDAGLGGVELQPVYPVATDDPAHGIRNTPYFTERWFDLLRHTARETSRLGLQFDIYHCQITEGDVTKRLEAHMPVIAHLQIADVPSRNEPGTGEIGWPFVFAEIDRLGYAGWVGCEYRPRGDTVTGLSWRQSFKV